MATVISAFDLLNLMVPAIAADPKFQAACQAIQGEFDAVTQSIPSIIVVPDVADQPANVLDNLAVQLHVYGYKTEYSNALKVSLILQSIQWHQKIGTPWVIQQALATIFSNAQLFEWWQYGGLPYHFELVMTNVPTGQQLSDMINVILELKNVRSYFDGFFTLLSSSGGLFVGGADEALYEWYVSGPMIGFPKL